MLDIGDLTTRWGKVFGGINEVNTFRGTTLPDRADDISALYTTAAAQAIVIDNLYEDTNQAADGLVNIYNTYVDIAKNTLTQMSVDDALYPIATDDTTLLKKLIADMAAQAESFLLPTVTIGGSATFVTATSVTTELGAPKGTGTIIGSIIEPRTGRVKVYAVPETERLVCTVDSYTGGTTSGFETFQVDGQGAVETTDPTWPTGSGASLTMNSATSENSTIVSNAYFESWDTTDTNDIDNWDTANLSPGTTISRTANSYVGSFAVALTAAPLNAELSQTAVGLTGATNYGVALRVRRPGTITAGVITVALRDSSGTILQDAAGNNLSFTISLSGAAGSYFITAAAFALQRAFPTTVKASIKVTTAMAGGETVYLDTFEIQPMQSVYTGGPDIAFFPGSTGWADRDTYTFAVANNADTTTFIRNIDRVYDIKSLQLDLPVAGSPTVNNNLIS